MRDNNRIPEVLRVIDRANNMKAKVGYISEGENKMKAAVHEFGVTIAVTPEMRAYLHHNGLHLKKSTTHIRIPERSFLRTGADINERVVQEKAAELIADVLSLGVPPELFFEMLGLELKGKIQEHARDLDHPVNHPYTVEQKGSSSPLVGTGEMIGSMEVEVE